MRNYADAQQTHIDTDIAMVARIELTTIRMYPMHTRISMHHHVKANIHQSSEERCQLMSGRASRSFCRRDCSKQPKKSSPQHLHKTGFAPVFLRY